MMRNSWFLLYSTLFLFTSVIWSQGGTDVTIVTDSERSVEPASRISLRPQTFDTVIPSPEINYPLLILREQVTFEPNKIEPATIRHKPQLSQLYNGYARLGGGSRLMGLGEVYYNSTRSRKNFWGVRALHLSEWGQISNYAPSQYDQTSANAYLDVNERRYSYGGEVDFKNLGLHYYGFENPEASRDSIRQRYNKISGSGYYRSHHKDSNVLNYSVGLEYTNFMDRRPDEDTLKRWQGRENFIAARSTWQYNMSNNELLSNMQADLDLMHNDYRYGIPDSTLSGLDSGFVSSNTVIQLRPTTHFYSKNEKFQFKLGGELAVDIGSRTRATLYPIGEVRYSLFDDLFIPYIGVEGGLTQQRFQLLAEQNEFISSNMHLRNMQHYDFRLGFKGTLSKRMTFNIGASFSNNRNMGLFINDTIYSSGNQFRVIYDTVNIACITGSLTYQHNEKIKFDGIARYNSYQARNNPHAWNLPDLEIILRGHYNISNKLIFNLDFTLEAGRKARVFSPNIPNVQEVDGVYFVPLGLIADANLGVEYRYTSRLSFFGNLNNFAAQRYQRWFDYPVQAFQFMLGASFRF